MRRVVLPLALAACGGGAGSETVEARLARDFAAQLGVEVKVSCPPGIYPKTCAVQQGGVPDLAIDVTEDKEGLAWTLTGYVIAAAPLAAAIGEELAELGVVGTVDCGAPLRHAAVGDRVRCELALAGGVAGAAWAKIVDDEGGFELELALDAATVAARTADADAAELERRSRELDRDDALGDDDEDGFAAIDAGVEQQGQ